MNQNSGMLLPVQQAYSEYLKSWYGQLYSDTLSMQEYTGRGADLSIMWVPGRMVDQAEEMIAMYRKAPSLGAAGANSLLPVVLVAMAKDYTPVPSEFGHQVGDRQLVTLADGPTASVYGYRQAMVEVRTQLAVFASDDKTAKSLAIQADLYIGAIANRRFYATYTWGQYTLTMPVMVESPEVNWQSVANDQKNLTILAGDIILRAVLPFLDAPATGQPNDGSANNPPGYPVIAEVVPTEQEGPI